MIREENGRPEKDEVNEWFAISFFISGIMI